MEKLTKTLILLAFDNVNGDDATCLNFCTFFGDFDLMWRPVEDTFEVKPNLSRDGFSEVDRKCNSLLPGVFRVLL